MNLELGVAGIPTCRKKEKKKREAYAVQSAKQLGGCCGDEIGSCGVEEQLFICSHIWL